uniref:Immediate early response 3-interacting protein 1 n=11 Tax=Caniformia TaxID=379584 RepID=A0A8C0Q7C7_CANLF
MGGFTLFSSQVFETGVYSLTLHGTSSSHARPPAAQYAPPAPPPTADHTPPADVGEGRVPARWGGACESAFGAFRAPVGERRPWRRHVPCGGWRKIGWASGRLRAAMAFTLYSLLQAALLCVNAIAVLHEERFLKNIGWGADQGIGGFGEEPGIKSQLMNLIRSVRTVMRVPLIIINSIAIVLLLLFG